MDTEPDAAAEPDDGDIRDALPGHRRGWTLRQRFEAADSYGLLLLLILLSTLCVAALSDTGIQRVLAVALLGLTLLFALRTSRAPKLAFRVALVVVPILVVAAILASSSAGDRTARVALEVMSLLLLFAVLLSILLRMGTHLTISWATVLAGICIYLLVGLIFGAIYGLMGALDNGVLFAGGQSPTAVNTTYFSFITLTTVGYGDLTMAESFPRMLAATEAVMGQIYLVVAVGLLIGNLGRTRQVRPPTQRG
jgi:Ion channel